MVATAARMILSAYARGELASMVDSRRKNRYQLVAAGPLRGLTGEEVK